MWFTIQACTGKNTRLRNKPQVAGVADQLVSTGANQTAEHGINEDYCVKPAWTRYI
jgi:hypothetical protein